MDAVSILFDMLAQFTGGRGGIDHVVVNYVIAALFWLVLWLISISKYKKDRGAREELLKYGFGFAFSREAFMISMALLQAFGVVGGEKLHEIFPPLEHTLHDLSLVVIAAAFLLYLTNDRAMAKKYAYFGLGVTLLCYLATFSWWADYIRANPTSKFGQVWADWVFHINRTFWATVPAVILWRKTSGWIRNAVVTAFALFAIAAFLKIPDMASNEVYENMYTPVSRLAYLGGIIMFGYVYLREQWAERIVAESKLSEAYLLMEKKVEQRTEDLRRSTERTNAILESAKDPILTVSSSGVILEANPRTFDVFGYEESDLIDKHIEILSAHIEDIGPSVGGGRLQELSPKELHLRRADGSTFVGALTSSRFAIEGDEYFSVFLYDLSAMKEAEAVKRDFVSVVSHELRTPLTSIRGSIDLVKAGVVGDLPPKAVELLEIASSNTKRLANLINDILDIDKLDAEAMSIELSKQPLMPLLEQVARENQGFASEFNVKLILGEGAHCDVNVEGNRFVQVLTNLVSNAVKFSPEGETVSIGAKIEATNVRVTVTDRGEGISPKDQERLFQKFAQLDSSSSRRHSGTGLGLYISKSLATKMHAQMGVDSEVGKGTTFYVDFPIAN